MDATHILVMVLQGSVALIISAAWLVVFYYLFKRWRRRKIDPGSIIPPVVYGAWQGHNLGTTTLDPGDLTEIEKDLGQAAKHTTD